MMSQVEVTNPSKPQTPPPVFKVETFLSGETLERLQIHASIDRSGISKLKKMLEIYYEILEIGSGNTERELGMTQNSIILSHLKSGKSITPLEALKLCGSLRLSERIRELQFAGNKISKHWVTVETRFGKRARVMEYFL